MVEKFLVMTTGTTSLSVDEIWPDGDAPERPTAADVADVMRRSGKFAVLNDWLVSEDLDMEIYGRSTYAMVFRGDYRSTDAETAVS